MAASQKKVASSRAQAATMPLALAAALIQVLPPLMQAALGAPRDLADAWVDALLAALEGRADARPSAVVLRGFDEQTT